MNMQKTSSIHIYYWKNPVKPTLVIYYLPAGYNDKVDKQNRNNMHWITFLHIIIFSEKLQTIFYKPISKPYGKMIKYYNLQ